MIYYRKNGKDTNKIKPKYVAYVRALQVAILKCDEIIKFDDLCEWHRSQGYWNLNTRCYDRLTDVLKEFKIKWIEKNDSPRGGLEGTYIIVRFDYRRKYINKILESEVE